MRLFLPLLFIFIFLGASVGKVFAQGCQTPTVTLPADMSYCGSQTIAFSSTNSAHKPSYSGTITAYSWSVDGVVKATDSNPSFSFPEGRTYQVSITVTSSCGTATDTQVITVDARPKAPVVENGGMCTGSAGTLWVTSPNPDLIYKWYNVASGGTPLVWGDTYTTTVTGTYYVEASTRGGCTSSTRTMATLTASSPTGSGGALSVGTQQICSGDSPGQISGNAPNSSFMTYQWYQSTTGADTDFFPILSARNKDYTPASLSQTTWFKRIAYNNYCGEESNVLKITVIPRPILPVVGDVVICYGSQASFRVANADINTVYKWYATATSTTVIGTGPTYTTAQNLTANTSFFVEASTTSNSICTTTTARVEARATVTPPITNNTISADQALCSGGTPAPLTGSAPQGAGGSYTYQWQRSENGSDFIDIAGANARDFAPGQLSTTTWYRRKVTSASSCPEVISNTIRIGVSPLPVSINITEPVTSCAGSGTTITITNADPAAYTYRWYDVATGGSILSTGSSFPTGPLTSDKTYYVEATTAAGCISNRRPVTVTVTNIPAKPVANGVVVCAGSSATLVVNPTDATLFYRWYNSAGTLLATGSNYVTGPVSANTTFYVEAVTKASPGCTSPKEAVTVTVLQPISNNTITGNQALCYGETPAALVGSIPQGGGGGYTYQWQYSEDGTLFTDIAGATGRDYAPGALSTTTWYRRRVSATGTCSPILSSAIKIEVNQLPSAPDVPGTTICTGTKATLQVTSPDANLTYKWYTVATGGTAVAADVTSFTTDILTSDKTYYIEAVSGFGCISAARTPVTVTVVQLPPVPVADNVTICAGGTATLSVLSPASGLTYQWFDAAQGGTLLATGTSITTKPLTAGTTYYVQAATSTGCASPMRKAVAVTVIPLPAIPDVAGATICSGSSTTLYVNNPEPGVTYRWYSGSTLLATGTSFPTGNLSSGASYYVDAVTDNATACASPDRRTVVVNVIPPITNNTVTASQTICSGSTPATLSGTTPAGGSGTLTYQWEKSEDGVNFTSIAGAINAAYTPGTLTTTTWYRRRVKGENTCPENISAAVQITVNALPATPIADSKTICTGTPATLSVNAPAAGLTYKWYSDATGGRILSATPSFTTGNLDANTTFYVEATNASGCTSARTPVTVTMRDLPEMPAAESKTVCAGQNTTLSVTSPSSAVTYKWYDADGRLLSSVPSLNLTNLQATTTYYLEAVYTSNPACASARREVTVTVTPLPNLPAVSDITICSGTKGVLQVQNASPDLTYKWYTTASGGSAIFAGPVFETPAALTSARTYYVEASTASGCISGRKPVTVNVSPLPETPFAANAEICAGASALLAVSDADASLTYQWYATNTAATPLAIGQTFPTGPLQATTTFYVEAMTAAGCVSDSRSAVTVNVTPLPATPNADDAITCAGGFAVLSVKSPSSSLLYKWYKNDGTYLATGINYNTGTLYDNTTYYLEAVTDNSTACASATRRTVTVTVTPVITNNTISSGQTICNGDTPATINGSIPAGGGANYAYQWEKSTDGSNFTGITGATGQHYTPGALTTTTWFRRRVSATGPCGPVYSVPVQITVVAPPATPLSDNQTICAGTTATLSISNVTPGYTYRWYSTATGGNILEINDAFETPELSATTTYYVEAVNGNDCVSPRRAVTVYVTARPAIPSVADISICEGQRATLTVSSSVQNLVYSWYDNAGTLVGTGTSYTTPNPLFAGTTFYVEAATITSPSCVSERRAVAVSVAAMPAMPEAADVTVCAGSTANLAVRVIDPAITYKWYTTAAGGTSVAESPNFTTSALTSNRTYYVEAVTAAGCTSARAAVTVSVTPLPATPSAANASICAGATASLTVTDADDNLVYNWYDAAEDGNLLATGTTFTTNSLQNSVTYYLEAATATGCASITRSAVTVNVTPLPATPKVNNQTICAGGNVTLWVTNQVPGIVYKWYDNTGTYLATGNSYTIDKLDVSTAYYVEAVTSTGTACTSASRKMVLVTVVLPVANNSIGTAQSVCTGAVPAPLTGTVPTGGNGNYTYLWERSTDGINFNTIGGAIERNFSPGALSVDTWYRRKVNAAGTCQPSISNSVKISVNPLPATPLADNVAICAGSTATLSIKNVNTADTYRWYNVPTEGNILATGTSFPTGILDASATFYVEAVNATGCISARKAVTVTVTPLPEAPVVADKTICAGGQTTLTVSGQSAGMTYRWYNGNGQFIASGSSFPTGVLSNSTVYYVEAAMVAAPSCVSARSTVTVNVTPLPATPLAGDVTICAGTTAKLAVTDINPDLIYQWYTSATGGTPVSIGSAYTTTALSSSATYFVEAVTAAGCTSATRKAVVVNVTQTPAMPVVAGSTICAGTSTTLAVMAPDTALAYNWYDNSGTLLATGTSFLTGNLNSSTTFYVEASSKSTSGCTSTRKAVTVNVTPLPATPAVDDVTICADGTATLTVINAAPSVEYYWYDDSETLLSTGTSFTTPTLTSGTTYYVEAVTTNGCASLTREAVTVNVTQSITNNIISAAQTICYGDTPATLSGLQPAGGQGSYSYQWEKSEDGLNFTSIAGATSASYSPGMLTTDIWFRRNVSTAGPCAASMSNVIRITVSPLPPAPVASNAIVCAGSTATLSINNAVAGYTYRWYSVATGGNILRTATTYTTDELQANTTYYVEAVTGGGCVSPRRAVTVTVTPVPGAPLVADKTICVGGRAVLSVSAADQSLVYRWYNSDGDLVATGATYTTETLNNSATYYAEAATVSTPECVSARSAVRVTVTPLPAIPVVADASVCAGEAAVLTIQIIDPAVTYKWYTSATGGTAVATGTSYNTGTLTSGRTYYVEAATASGCASPRASIRVDVTPLPATPAAANAAVCAGQTATLAVSGPDTNLSYRWYDAATDGNLLATGDTYTTGALSASATYFVEAVTATGCASNTRKAVTVNVTPLPAAPEADNVTICAGSSTTLWVKNQEPNMVYNWYNGSALAGTGISFTTGNLSNSTTYYLEAVTNNSTACASASRSAVVVTVTPALANNFINASQSICSGSTPATLTGSLPNGGGGNYSYQWERSEDGINFTAIANATNQNYTPNALNITTWFRRKVRAAGPCAESISSAVQITTTPIPAMPAADDVTVCEGTTATLSIKDANTAYTYRWYTTPVGGSAVFANTSYTTPPLESTTTFYVEAVNATGCISPRRALTVSVRPLPDAPMAADQNICAGEKATLAVSNQLPGLTYSWYNGNGDLLATGTTFTTPQPLNSNTTFYVEASSSATPSCTSSRTAVAVNVAARPATPLADDVSICAGSAASLAVKGVIPGLTYKWYTVATGGLPVYTGSNYSTAALTTGRTYYVEAATASGCTSVSRKAVVVSVIQPPAAPTAADKTICAGQQVTLTVSNPDASLLYQWYDQSGAPLATGNTYTTTTAPAASTTFYVAAATLTSPSCTGPREAVAVTVTPLPETPEVEEATVCAGSTATLWISNVMPSTIYKWYDESDVLQGTGPSFTTPALATGTTYFVAAETANGCASTTRQTVTVNVVQPITNNVISAAQMVCYGGSPAMLTGSQPLGGNLNYTYQWESSEDGTNFRSIANATGKDYTPGALTATTWFRRSVSAGNTCTANTSKPVSITVVPLPAMPFVGNTTVCAGVNAVLTVTSPNTDLTYRWYATATGGGSIATGDSFTATSVAGTTTYFVEAVNASGCNSARRAVTVYVVPLPEAPQAADKSICAGELTTLSVISPDAGLLYNWYDANGVLQQTGSSFTTPTLNRTTLYYVEAVTTEQSCPGPRKAVRVNVTQQPATPLVDNVTVCAGSAASMTVKNYDPALTYKWYIAAAGGVVMATGPTFNTTNLTSGRIYYVEAATATGCLSARTAVTVDVTPLPALPVVSNQTICAGETATFTVADENAGLAYRWYDAPLGGTLLATGNTFTTGNLNRSSTYYVETATSGGCVSPSRKPVVVTVSPLPAAPAVENASICSGESVTLWVKNPDPALEYKWYSDAAATDQVGSGISYTSPPILANQHYFVSAVNSNNCASPTMKQVDVTVISKPGAPLVEDAIVCAGGNAMLSVSTPDPTVVYKWYNINGTLLHTGTTYTTEALTSNTTYTVTAYAAASQTCASASQAVTVTVIPAITDNEISEDQAICYNSAPAKLTGTFPAGGGTNLLYQWERSPDGVNFTGITGANAQDYTSGALTATTWFRRKVKTAGPCPESISNVVKITVSPLPNAPLADNVTTCAGSSAILTVRSAQSGLTYSWYDAPIGGTFLGTGISYTTDALTVNSTFYVEATNTSGCTSSSRRAVSVSVVSAVGNNIIRDVPPVCYGETPGKLTGTPPTGTGNGYTYQWQRSDNGVKFLDIPGATAQNYTPTEAYTKTTWFRRKVVATGPCPESYSNLVKLEVVPLPLTPVAASVEVCPGSSATLSATAANGETLEWYDAPTGGNLLHQGNTFTTPALNTSAVYFVQAVNSTGCISSERREVKADVVVPQAIVSGDATIFYGKAVKISAEGGVSYKWSPETGLSDPTSASPMASPKETTTYTVTVTTAGGCTATNQLTVTVSPKVEPANAITPNGDGYNDVFQIKNLEAYENCTVQIFSRWGELVFESRGYATPWDGTKKGQPLPVGAYYYIIHLNSTEPPISGSVTLVK
ncbi:gliding motility-associated C-terminal domain-containing protein [Pontibacter sp. 172403-2]|uniref:Ig-like domain-containing protein n=1 Tax=Pontibacter rufus TaxID=2791028 RepID=UPI0018AFA6F1|nr:gliding motility-associated C-terminal domain-containing protein [Pontibacter sp. 172403-2]MBF9253903.1 gliding motility-associated C-terminal domain-containing protein [Pontibacter sp. 172403-2]